MERVGVLGGTFDPVHNGHLGIAAEAKAKFCLDRVLFVPVNISPHKRQRVITPAHHRLEMLRLAIQAEPSFVLSTIEIERSGISYTIDTLQELETANPAMDLFLIMGIDTFKELGSWKEPLRLLERYHFLVGTRPGYSLGNSDEMVRQLSDGAYVSVSGGGEENIFRFQHKRSGKTLVFFEIGPRPVSSSEVRENVSRHKEIKNMLPPEVENYIMRHQLYQAEPSPLV